VPSTGVFCPNGILRPSTAGIRALQVRTGVGIEAPRGQLGSERVMRYIGIDIGSVKHSVAIVDENRKYCLKPRFFNESQTGYAELFAALGSPEDAVVAMEATGHYWQNIHVELARRNFAVVLINPLRTRRYAEEDLIRAKTDKIDAGLIARFAAEKRATGERATNEVRLALRELVSLRDRLQQDLDDRGRQLHRALDLSFPESKPLFKSITSLRTTTILKNYPGGKQLAEADRGELAKLVYDRRHCVGDQLASDLIELAKVTVGAHQGGPYSQQIIYYCEDIQTLHKRLKDLERDIEKCLDGQQLPTLLMSIPGIGALSVARIMAMCGDPSTFESGGALAAYVGVAPQVKHSGKRTPLRATAGAMSNSRLRAKLWSPTIVGIRHNPWLQTYYQRLLDNGKPKKVAIIACMRKLLLAIYSVAKNRKPFEIRPAPGTETEAETEITSVLASAS
jgi:transposase